MPPSGWAQPARATIAVLDIDHFKRVNDRYGHEAGDEVLRLLRDRPADHPRRGFHRAHGRRGVRDFVPGHVERPRQVHLRAVRLELAGAIIFAGTSPVRITVSGGVAELGPNGIDQALKTADDALYQAKEDGRDRLTIAA